MGGNDNPSGTVDGITYNDLSIASTAEFIGPVQIVLNGTSYNPPSHAAPLVDTGNAATGWNVSLELVWDTTGGAWGNNNGSQVDPPYPSSLDAIATTALQDNLYLNGDNRGRITLSGLDDNASYDLRFYSNETTDATSATMLFIPVTGTGSNFLKSQPVQIDAYQNGTGVVEWSGVWPEGGEIAFDIRADEQGWMNFMSVEEVLVTDGLPRITSFLANDSNPGHYDLTWTSKNSLIYDLVSSTGLNSGPETWPVWPGYAGMAASGSGTNTLTNLPGGDDPRRFFALFARTPPTPPLENGSFEEPFLPEDDYIARLTGWSATENLPTLSEFYFIEVYGWHPGADYYPAGAPDGENVGDIAYLFDIPGESFGLSQVLEASFAENTVYTVTVRVGRPEFLDWPGFRVELRAGDTLLAFDQDPDTTAPTAGNFITSTVTYTYDAAHQGLVGEDLEIRLLSRGQDPEGGLTGLWVVNFDDVTFTASAP